LRVDLPGGFLLSIPPGQNLSIAWYNLNMNKDTALKVILGISIAGILFSGYLSYGELTAKVCPLGGCSYVLGLPTCVYGLVMYLAVFIISVMGLKSKK
jgi:uncharacterized membrane protein